MTSGKAPRPKTDAQMAFDLLMELYDRGQTLDTKSQVELVNKFLAVREPGRQVPRWGLFLKANRAERIVKEAPARDRKSTRLNSSHLGISYAVFCLKKKKKKRKNTTQK